MRPYHHFAVLLCLLTGCIGSDRTASLDDFVGKDLGGLDDDGRAALRRLLADKLPEQYRPSEYDSFQCCVLWKGDCGDGPTRFVLVEGWPLRRIPGQSTVAVHLFDASGAYLSSRSFSTGHRIQLEAVDVRWEPVLGRPIIEVRTHPSINGADLGRQIYAVLDDQVALLRLEYSNGDPFRNDYDAPNHTIGPPVPERTPVEWEQILVSGDQPATLEALVWLGGDHRTKLTPFPDEEHIYIENLESARLVAATRQRLGVQRAVAELTRSGNPWVQQAAASVDLTKE